MLVELWPMFQGTTMSSGPSLGMPMAGPRHVVYGVLDGVPVYVYVYMNMQRS